MLQGLRARQSPWLSRLLASASRAAEHSSRPPPCPPAAVAAVASHGVHEGPTPRAPPGRYHPSIAPSLLGFFSRTAPWPRRSTKSALVSSAPGSIIIEILPPSLILLGISLTINPTVKGVVTSKFNLVVRCYTRVYPQICMNRSGNSAVIPNDCIWMLQPGNTLLPSICFDLLPLPAAGAQD
jgi:hypothetical protein